MILADKNVLFSFAVANAWSERARALFYHDDAWCSKCHALVEITNVLVRYVRNRLMRDGEARDVLDMLEELLAGRLYQVAHRDAYGRVCNMRVSAYDARFLVMSRELGSPLVTEDAKLRGAAPTLTQSIEQALAG